MALKSNLRWWPIAAFPLLFFVLGWFLLPYAGLQQDEVLFATPDFHQTSSSIFTIPVDQFHVPVMLLSYLGALKTWLYAPLFLRTRPSYLSVRLPVLLIGAMTIGLFVWFLERVHGRKAAVAGGLLLATDTVFLLTTCFDWGPVVLQHFLAMAGLVLLVKFATAGSRLALSWGFIALGLGMWDKALFSWTLIGLAVATLAVFPREVWSRCTLANLGRAVTGFCLGALPLLIYNFSTGFDTFRSNSSFTLREMPLKVRALESAWEGSSLFSYLVSSPLAPGQPREPESVLERASAEVHSAFGEHTRNALSAGLLGAAVLFLALLWRKGARRTLLFCLIAMSLAWLQMAVTKNAGLSAHHIALLWPLPHWFMAVAFAEASEWNLLRRFQMGKWLFGAVILFLVAANLLLTNQYLYRFARYGAAGPWSDAIYRLSDATNRYPGSELVIDDWGILNPLVVLHRGRLPLIFIDESFLTPGESEKQHAWDQGLAQQHVWIGHTQGYRVFGPSVEKIEKSAESLGLRKQILELVPDRNGRPVFEIFRFARDPSS